MKFHLEGYLSDSVLASHLHTIKHNTLINSPTNTGKTVCMVNHAKQLNEKNQNVLLVMPYYSLCVDVQSSFEQANSWYGEGSQKLCKDEAIRGTAIVTFDNFAWLIKNRPALVKSCVIHYDEVQSLYESYSYRKCMLDVYEFLMSRVTPNIMWSGTFRAEYFDKPLHDEYIEITAENKVKTKAFFVETETRHVEDYIISFLEERKGRAIVYRNDIDANEALAKNYKNSLSVNSGDRMNPAMINLLKDNSMAEVGAEIIFATKFIEAGISIIDEDITDAIVVADKMTAENIKQFSARARRAKQLNLYIIATNDGDKEKQDKRRNVRTFDIELRKRTFDITIKGYVESAKAQLIQRFVDSNDRMPTEEEMKLNIDKLTYEPPLTIAYEYIHGKQNKVGLSMFVDENMMPRELARAMDVYNRECQHSWYSTGYLKQSLNKYFDIELFEEEINGNDFVAQKKEQIQQAKKDIKKLKADEVKLALENSPELMTHEDINDDWSMDVKQSVSALISRGFKSSSAIISILTGRVGGQTLDILESIGRKSEGYFFEFVTNYVPEFEERYTTKELDLMIEKYFYTITQINQEGDGASIAAAATVVHEFNLAAKKKLFKVLFECKTYENLGTRYTRVLGLKENKITWTGDKTTLEVKQQPKVSVGSSIGIDWGL